MTAAGFAKEFEGASRVLWCIAAGMLGERRGGSGAGGGGSGGGGGGGAADVVQQAAVVGLENLNDFQPGTSYLAWMGRIVRNLALNESRKRRRQRTSAVDPSDLHGVPGREVAAGEWAAGGGGGMAAFAGAGAMGGVTVTGGLAPGQEAFDDAVAWALGELEETARACLLMRTVMEMPYRQISLALDIPEGTAMSHVHRSRRAMRERLAAWEARGGKGGGGTVGGVDGSAGAAASGGADKAARGGSTRGGASATTPGSTS